MSELEAEDEAGLDSTGAVTEVDIDSTSETEAGDVSEVRAGGESEDGLPRDSIIICEEVDSIELE